jgi:Inner membrane protein YgaP-like, transmembrane domain
MKNVGSADRIIRIVLGIAIGAWGIWAQNWWGLVGLVPLGTALMGWCPAYFPFKINTAKK